MLSNESSNEFNLRKEITYPEDWRYKMIEPIGLSKNGPYAITEYKGEKYIVSESLMPFDKDYAEDVQWDFENAKQYNPFEEPDLLVDVSKIRVDDEQSILEFCNKYGILGGDPEDTTKEEMNMLLATIKINNFTLYEKLNYFVDQIKRIQRVIELNYLINPENKGELKEWFKKRDEIVINSLKNLIYRYEEMGDKEKVGSYKESLSKHLLRTEKIKNSHSEAIMEAKELMVRTMNINLINVSPVIRLNENGQFVEGVTSYTLLGVIYHQLYKVITKGHSFDRCIHCGSLFPPRKSKTKFCPPDKYSEHSRCANAYNAMVRRVREWYFKEGLTVDEIQEKITEPRKRTLEEIQNWIDSYQGKMRKK
ncbi:MAG: hypothetical protein ACO1OT_09680 [Heyndrickxia sp.]